MEGDFSSQPHDVICNCRACKLARATGSVIIDEDRFQASEDLFDLVKIISFSLDEEKGGLN